MVSFVFLHGLNTWGDDDFHLGPVRYGSMNTPWEKALVALGQDVYSPEDLHFHPIEQQAELVIERIKKNGWIKRDNLFVIGHSSGGLIARVLASHNETREKIRGVITLGTPNHGTPAAELGLKLANEGSVWGKCLSLVGYDPKHRVAIFERYLATSLAEFNARYPATQNPWVGYALCESPKTQLSWPLMLGYNFIHKDLAPGKSDGFVASESQAWGECLGRFELDHLGCLGFFFQILPSQRAKARREFSRLAKDVVRHANALVSN